MISEKITMKSCVGRWAVVTERMYNGAGNVLEKGCKVKIIASNSGGMKVITETCPHCKQAAFITQVKRHQLTLLPEEKTK